MRREVIVTVVALVMVAGMGFALGRATAKNEAFIESMTRTMDEVYTTKARAELLEENMNRICGMEIAVASRLCED